MDAISEDSMNQLLGHSITYRIAVGPQAGRKVFALQTLPACDPDEFADTAGPGRMSARNWSVCAVTSVGQPLRKSDFRLRQAATSATS
jgi:hypothetical protein